MFKKSPPPLRLTVLPDANPELHFRLLPDGRYELTLAGYFPVVVAEAVFELERWELELLCMELTAQLIGDEDDPMPPPAGRFLQDERGDHEYRTFSFEVIAFRFEG